MKIRMFVLILILAFIILNICEGYAADKKVTKKDYKFYSGTWINEEYNSHPHLARYVMRRDGTFDCYFRTKESVLIIAVTCVSMFLFHIILRKTKIRRSLTNIVSDKGAKVRIFLGFRGHHRILYWS